jgi:ABC-type spermidine/putrescine transport system permease subunit I
VRGLPLFTFRARSADAPVSPSPPAPRPPEARGASAVCLLLLAPAVLLLTVFLLGPLLLLVRVSLFLPATGRGFSQPGTWTAGTYADLLALGVTLLVLLLAYPLALFLHRLPPRPKTVGLAAVVLPKLASVLVTVYGLQALLSGDGPVNQFLLALGLIRDRLTLTRNLTGVVLGETYLLLPYAVLVLVVALDRIDPLLAAAARGLGASPWLAFRRVTLPLSLPGLVVAGQLTLVWSLGAFVGPLLLGSPEEITLAVEVHRQAVENNRWPRGAATAVVLTLTFLLAVALWALLRRLLRRRDS